MKEDDNIPVSRFSRTGSFLVTGAKVGGNYLRYYGKKVIGRENEDELQEKNAGEIYRSLSKLKGSALKVAQMMSMDEGILPQAYTEKFAQAQYSVPPLSFPLVVKTFQSELGKSPLHIFDEFSREAVAAASIGQVHKAVINGKDLAVKVQYPGVAGSIGSDLKIIKPIVRSFLNISSSELNHYLLEIEERLMEETDYRLELERSSFISGQCRHINGLNFPKFYPEYSSDRILSMDWMPGMHLQEFLAGNPSQEILNKVGQTLWDFYDFQIHELKQLHADPHPGNFLFTADGEVGVLDFGCVKILKPDFYENYFQLMEPGIAENEKRFTDLLYQLNFLLEDDNEEQIPYFRNIYRQLLLLLGKPFGREEFDFSEPAYFREIYQLQEIYSRDKILRKAKAARGPRDGIYLHRTYFGLYSILHKLGAKVQTGSRLKQLFC